MGGPKGTVPSLEQFAIAKIRRELAEIRRSSDVAPVPSSPSSEQLLKDCALQLAGKINQTLSEFSDVDSLAVHDLDTCSKYLKEELNSLEAETAKISNEVEDLARAYVKDSNRLESDLEALNCSLDFIELQGLEKPKLDATVDCSADGEYQINLSNANGGCKFKILELGHQIEKNKSTLKSLQDLDCFFKRFEATEKIVDALTGLKVIEFEGNCIRLSLSTCVPNLGSILRQQNIECVSEPFEQIHELLIELVNGTMELKSVEIFPNDVYIGEIADAAKSFRQLSHLSMLERRSSLEWFVRRVQDRIALCTLRRFVVKCANKSRHSFEYLDRDEIIVAHMVGGVDAFIKASQGWPVSCSSLKLKTLKSSSHYSKEISLSFLCEVEEFANSLDGHVRQNVSSFVDAIEEILMQRMQAILRKDNSATQK